VNADVKYRRLSGQRTAFKILCRTTIPRPHFAEMSRAPSADRFAELGWSDPHGTKSAAARLLADLSVRRTVARILSLPLRHVFALLCIPVPTRTLTVIHTGASVHPNFHVGVALIFSLRCGGWLPLAE